ncbi:hypothetical protein [Terricaulis sp.]|uniref:hypothetical protein n=1 Tax=Terricaulis sp. TaxID=2768686 RepID=UPI002AC631F7|nr:hypothetical protein [Terricaulis sp.]MDZ4692576.1 hypothetical protein [Terricaulis sp.]
MLFAWGLNVLALCLGAALGARALIDPKWAARFVRLKADEQGGGFAEFRATYGGVFLGLHLAALLLALRYLLSGGALVGVVAAGASAALCAGWAGAAFGRFVSMVRDRTDTKFNRISCGVELAMALAIGMPWFVWALS